LKSIDYIDFQFRHRINLREYLNQFYSLTFSHKNDQYVCDQTPILSIHVDGKYENTWVRSNVSKGVKNKHGIFLKYGTIINWEAIEHDCSISEALGIINKNKRNLADYKTNRYKKLEVMSMQVASRFRHSRLPIVANYLKDRGIDYAPYAKDFNIGSPKSYGPLVNTLINHRLPEMEVIELLEDLFIVQQPYNYRYLPFEHSVIVPVHDKAGGFVGFHGRRIDPGDKKRYYNTGYLRDLATEIMFGEDKQDIQDAVAKKKQLILTKGIFDFFICYQDDHKQVMATLNKGITATQFDRIMKMQIDEVVVGFEKDSERAKMAGLMSINLSKVRMKTPKLNSDLDDIVTKQGMSIDNTIKSAQLASQDAGEGLRRASLKRRNQSREALFDDGQKFLVLKDDLLTEIASSKRASGKLKKFLKKKANAGIRTYPWGTEYVPFTPSFMLESILGDFGAELRMLLLLLAKSTHSDKINYTNAKLGEVLDLSEPSIIEYRKRLVESGYLLIKKSFPTKKKPKSSFDYYPSIIKFIMEPSNDPQKD
jgi:hypothetical protein